MTPPRRPADAPARWEAAIHIFALSGYVLAQPIYALLGENPEFFAVRNHGIADIGLLVAGLSGVVPGILALVVALARRFSFRLFRTLLGLVLAVGVAVFVMPLLRDLLAYSVAVNVGVSAAIGALGAFAYFRWGAARLFLTCLAPGIVIFPVIFVGFSGLRALWSIPEPPQVDPPPIESTVPIVMIVLDELPVTTLMTPAGAIDGSRFPAFAALSATATWYPNATTVAEYTVDALPALLTGNVPPVGNRADEPKRNFADHIGLPTYRSYPYNLFTALKDRYELRVFETLSSLCPEGRCPRTFDRDLHLTRRFSGLVRDLSVVYLHLILPHGLGRHLPRIDMSWREFVQYHQDQAGKEDDDVMAFESFLDALTPTDRPGLYFHHTGLPHGPWKFLPSGHRYRAENYSQALPANQRWGEAGPGREPLQRHLLQAMFSDRLLGRALAKLETEGLLDQALIVVTADHGAAFVPREHFRLIEDRNATDIVGVPLLIKRPGQRQGRIDRTHVRSIDLMPTLFAELGEQWPWPSEGQPVSRLAGRRPGRLEIITREGELKEVVYDPAAQLETLRRNAAVLGESGREGIFGGPRYAFLIGYAPAASCGRLLDASDLLLNPDAFRGVDPDSGEVPAWIGLRSPFPRMRPEELLLVAVGDRVAAVFDREPILDQHGRFYGMIDERAIRAGDNRIEFRAASREAPCARG